MRAVLNDVHSGLNESAADRLVHVSSIGVVRAELAAARAAGRPVAIAGGRHAMGGQQFCDGGVVLDMRALNRVLGLDSARGLVEVEAGIEWPGLITELGAAQSSGDRPWVIAQKQTGADRMTIGGSIAANVHGRGLTMRPFVDDIESFVIVAADGAVRECSREQNRELFALAVGGYGLFGCIVSARLRLVRRSVVERVVELVSIDRLLTRVAERISDGFRYGDFQFATDPTSADFLHRGVFSCYRPVDAERRTSPANAMLTREDWRELIRLAHTDKRRAFERYSQHYLETSGQLYYSDEHQLSEYEDGYHRRIDTAMGTPGRGSEMISELYVPRGQLIDFMQAAAQDFRAHEIDVIYGTVRFIESDGLSYLAWAREPWACVIFNLHTEHTPAAIERTAAAFRRLIDLALARGGSYFLTYHRWASRRQVEACYPQFAEFLRLKRLFDPEELFQSDWYRHYRSMFADSLASPGEPQREQRT